MEGLSEGQRHLLRAVPAELDDRCLECGYLERQLQTLRRTAGVQDQVRPIGRSLWPPEPHPKRPCNRLSSRIDVDELDLASRNTPGEPRHEAADGARPHDGQPIPD